MAERVRAKKRSSKKETGTAVEQDEASEQSKREEMLAELDDLLDNIDDVLEENAEDFVKEYIQKGGQ